MLRIIASQDVYQKLRTLHGLNLIMSLAKRVFRELRMLCSFRHENVLAARDVLLPCSLEAFDELYVLTPLMQEWIHLKTL